MRIFFLIFLLAYVGGNVYIFIRTLQMLSGFAYKFKLGCFHERISPVFLVCCQLIPVLLV